jgi:LDH2 family malate/lactate/ureidoglycolate dehydrogenase
MQEVETIPYQKLCTYVSQALIAAGVADDQAELEAEIMAEADLLEVPSHGVRMLPPLLTALREGRVNARPNFQIQREMGAICILDCDNGPGRFASMTAMQAAINRAQSFGVGVCLARNTTHWGRAHAYASRAAQQGFIGICTTNAIPTMAVWGAKKPVIGNNPLAIAVPGVKADEPWVRHLLARWQPGCAKERHLKPTGDLIHRATPRRTRKKFYRAPCCLWADTRGQVWQ